MANKDVQPKQRRETDKIPTVLTMVNSLSGILQALVLAMLLWTIQSVSSLRETTARLEERVVMLSSSSLQLQHEVTEANNDRYSRSDANADFAKRDAKIDQLEQDIVHNKDLATQAIINQNNKK